MVGSSLDGSTPPFSYTFRVNSMNTCPQTNTQAQVTKSNLHNFWYSCLVLALIDVSEVLAQTLHDCMTYERKEKPKICVKFQVQLIN